MSSTQVSIFSVAFKENKLIGDRKKRKLTFYLAASLAPPSVPNWFVSTCTKQERQDTEKHKTEALSCNFCRSWKAITINIIWVCVLSRKYPACNAHASYCHLCPASLYNIFFILSHKRYDFRKKVTEHKLCVLIFSPTLIWNISHSKKNSTRYDQKCVLVYMKSTG
jgi:hypothetical protein